MDQYNPGVAPPGAAWLALSEQERRSLVEVAHAEVVLPNHTVHATLHVIVENQLALGDPPATPRTLSRLVARGMPRHDAVHAIGRVLLETMNRMVQQSKEFDPEEFERKLDAI